MDDFTPSEEFTLQLTCGAKGAPTYLVSGSISLERVVDDLEKRLWERIEPRIRREMLAKHMTVGETAEYLHLSAPTVRRLMRDKAFPFFKARGVVLVRRHDVDDWIERQLNEGG